VAALSDSLVMAASAQSTSSCEPIRKVSSADGGAVPCPCMSSIWISRDCLLRYIGDKGCWGLLDVAGTAGGCWGLLVTKKILSLPIPESDSPDVSTNCSASRRVSLLSVHKSPSSSRYAKRRIVHAGNAVAALSDNLVMAASAQSKSSCEPIRKVSSTNGGAVPCPCISSIWICKDCLPGDVGDKGCWGLLEIAETAGGCRGLLVNKKISSLPIPESDSPNGSTNCSASRSVSLLSVHKSPSSSRYVKRWIIQPGNAVVAFSASLVMAASAQSIISCEAIRKTASADGGAVPFPCTSSTWIKLNLKSMLTAEAQQRCPAGCNFELG